MAELLLTDSQPASAFSMGDVIHALFKHKWKIVLGTIAGIVAATTVYVRYQPVYQSDAKLLVRYVLDRATIDSEAGSAPKTGEAVIGGEVEILTSWDLAMDVVEGIGVKRLLGGAEGAKTDAAATVANGLRVFANPQSNIIYVAYSNGDPELATLVLSELVNRYFNKHLEVHRSAGAFDFVTQQTDQVHARLTETEDALKALKTKAGIISLSDSYAALSGNLSRTDDEIHNWQEGVGEQRALVARMEGAAAAGASEAAKAVAPRGPSAAENTTYRATVGRLNALREGELDLLSKYTEDNPFVKIHREQIATLDKQREEMERKFPDLIATRDGSPPPTLAMEKGKLAAMEGKVEALKGRMANIQQRVRELSELGSQISDLERNKALQEQSYNYFKSTLEKARIDEALDPSKIPNITAVQRPTPPHRVYGKRDKQAMGLAGGGLGAVVALVLLSELFLNHTVKRPLELEKRIGAPLLVSIPYHANGNGRRLLRRKSDGGNGKNGNGKLAPWEADHFIRPYAVAIRDRLGLYFELNRMTHKPKLVGVTGFKEGGGTSTLAAGLAAALSEMGDGKVLLVDVNLGPHEVHPFFKGRPAVSLSTALQANGEGSEPAADNLYLAMVAPPSDGPAQLGLKKFFDMMPNLKASDFDYVIFDMPPVSQTSPTVGMAGFMDKVLLMVEAEKSNRDAVKRGFEALTTQRDNVSVIFNKARTYSPKWLNGDS